MNRPRESTLCAVVALIFLGTAAATRILGVT